MKEIIFVIIFFNIFNKIKFKKKQLKESQSTIKALETTNTTLRDAISQQSNRLNRTVEALKIAGTNAATARADAGMCM